MAEPCHRTRKECVFCYGTFFPPILARKIKYGLCLLQRLRQLGAVFRLRKVISVSLFGNFKGRTLRWI
jgi:hypothetical protein